MSNPNPKYTFCFYLSFSSFLFLFACASPMTIVIIPTILRFSFNVNVLNKLLKLIFCCLHFLYGHITYVSVSEIFFLFLLVVGLRNNFFLICKYTTTFFHKYFFIPHTLLLISLKCLNNAFESCIFQLVL